MEEEGFSMEDAAEQEAVLAPPDGARKVKPLELGFLAQGGVFCAVRIKGGGMQTRMPEEPGDGKKRRALLPRAAREWVSQRNLRFLPADEWKKLKSLEQRLRSVPKKCGLVILGVDPRSSGRWVPHSARAKFDEEYNRIEEELLAFLEEMDSRQDELFEQWRKVVGLLSRRFGLSESTQEKLLDSFPQSFVKQVRPHVDRFVIANPIDLETAAAEEAEAKAKHAVAQAKKVEAEAMLHAAEVEAEILVSEHKRLAWQQVRAAQRDIDRMLLQVRSEVYEGMRKVVEGMEKGGRAIGPAIRRLRNIHEQFQLLNQAGDEDLEVRLQELVEQCAGGQSGSTAVLQQAKQLTETLQADHEAWEDLVDEYTI